MACNETNAASLDRFLGRGGIAMPENVACVIDMFFRTLFGIFFHAREGEGRGDVAKIGGRSNVELVDDQGI
jgi:hypothetical protein